MIDIIFFNYNIKIFNYMYYKDYFILYSDNIYLFKKYSNSSFYNINSMYHSLIMTNKGSKYIKYDNDRYCLLKVNFKSNRYVLLSDLFNNIYTFSYSDIKSLNWSYLWELKIDNLENYINSLCNISFDTLVIINYFIGLSELAIIYFNNIFNNSIEIGLCHSRVSYKDDLYKFYDYDNIIIDYKYRDVSEYIKSLIFDYKKVNLKFDYVNNDLIISRLLFPSLFFDYIDFVVANNIDINDISSRFDINRIEELLKFYIGQIKKS